MAGVMNRIQSGSGLWTGGVAQEPGLDYRSMDVVGCDRWVFSSPSVDSSFIFFFCYSALLLF